MYFQTQTSGDIRENVWEMNSANLQKVLQGLCEPHVGCSGASPGDYVQSPGESPGDSLKSPGESPGDFFTITW